MDTKFTHWIATKLAELKATYPATENDDYDHYFSEYELDAARVEPNSLDAVELLFSLEYKLMASTKPEYGVCMDVQTRIVEKYAAQFPFRIAGRIGSCDHIEYSITGGFLQYDDGEEQPTDIVDHGNDPQEILSTLAVIETAASSVERR